MNPTTIEILLVCQIFGFISVSTAFASILTILAMSIERALVITYSINAKKRFTAKAAWLIIIIIWLISLISCIPPLFGKVNRYTLDPSKTSCTRKYANIISIYLSDNTAKPINEWQTSKLNTFANNRLFNYHNST